MSEPLYRRQRRVAENQIDAFLLTILRSKVLWDVVLVGIIIAMLIAGLS